MRKKDKKEKNRRLFMSIFIVVIMSLSVFGFMMGKDSGTQLRYNDLKFTQLTVGNQLKWVTEINKQDIAFDYFPANIENIEIDPAIIDRIKNSPQIDFTSDPNSTFKEAIALSQFELSKVFAVAEKYSRVGFNQENEYNIPVITCEETTSIIPVLFFERSNETKVYQKNNCIFVTARSQQDFLILKDRLIYGVFGVI